jgi:hypothetical protein
MSTILDLNVSDLTDQQLDEKIQELTKKFYTSARLGNPYLQQQVSMAIEMHREEISRRQYNRMKSEQDNLGDLIKVNK